MGPWEKEGEEPLEEEKWCFQRQKRSRQGQRPREPWAELVQGGRRGRPTTCRRLPALERTGRERGRAPDSAVEVRDRDRARSGAGWEPELGQGVGAGTCPGTCTPPL